MKLRHDLVVEVLESDVLVLESAGVTVHRLTGDVAEATRLLASGAPADTLPERLAPALRSLRAAGLLDEPADAGRRRLLMAGVGAAIGITTLSLPSAAAASSAFGGGGGGGVFYTLSVTETGTGGGRVVSNPVGIDTDVPTTASTFGGGSTVQLTATADTYSTFGGWTGDVTSSDATINVTMSANRSVTATFTKVFYTLTVNETGFGTGGVTSNVGDIDTSGATTTDSASLAGGTVVTLTAAPDTDSSFAGWSGDGSGTATSIDVTMSAAKTVTARFVAIDLTSAAAGNAQFSVSWDES